MTALVLRLVFALTPSLSALALFLCMVEVENRDLALSLSDFLANTLVFSRMVKATGLGVRILLLALLGYIGQKRTVFARLSLATPFALS